MPAPVFPSRPLPEPVDLGVPSFGAMPPAPAPTPAPAPPLVVPPSPLPMNGPPAPTFAPPMQLQPQQSTGANVAQLVPALLMGLKGLPEMGAALRGLQKGRDAKLARQEHVQQTQERRQREATEFYSRAIEESNKITDPVDFENWRQMMGPVSQYYGIDPHTFVFNANRWQKSMQGKLVEALDAMEKRDASLAGRDDFKVVTEDYPQGISAATVRTWRGQAKDSTGKAILPAAKPDALTPNTPEEQFYAQYAAEALGKPTAKFSELPTAKQLEARKVWHEASAPDLDLAKASLDVQAAAALKKGDTAEYERLRKVKREMGDAGRQQPIVINNGQAQNDPRVQQAAQLIASNRLAPSQLSTFFTGMGKESVSQLRPAVMQAVMAINPDFDFAAAESNYAYGKNTGTQNTVRYIDNISKTLPVLEQASQEFARSQVRSINSILKSGKSQFGAVDVAKFDLARTILADEIAKIMQGGGSGSGTSDAKLKQASELLAGDMTAQQFQTVLDTAKELISARRDTLTKGTFMETKPTPAAPKKVGRFEIVDVK
jgi:hypothetical protein